MYQEAAECEQEAAAAREPEGRMQELREQLALDQRQIIWNAGQLSV